MNSVTECLRKVELFQDISTEELALFTEHAEYKKLSAGESLFHREDLTDTLYVIASGSVQLFDDRSGTEQSITVFSKHEFIGESILIAPVHKQGFSARLIADTHLYLFKRDALIELLSKHGKLALTLSATISQLIIRRMKYANNRYENIAALYRTGVKRMEHDL